MSPLFRRIGIPLLMLLLGWQLGVGYTQQALRRSGQPIGTQTGSGTVLANPQQEADLSLMWHVWGLLNEHYIEPDKLTSNTLTQGAVEGLVRAVGDPYTLFMTPVENTGFRESLSGKLQGIGAELTFRDGIVVVVAPLKGSPAERAGLLPEDIIIEVNGESVEGLTLDDVVRRIRGEKGTSVKVTIIRKNAPVTYTIVREEIRVPSVEARMLSASGTVKSPKAPVGYVALNQFGEGSIEEVEAEVQKLVGQGAKSLILDLRFNGGGYLDGAVDLASLFLDKGRVVTVQHRKGPAEEHDVSGRPPFGNLPLVILQNEGSASASEITAGALQDHGRATIIGKKSFGKGTVQEVIDVPGGGSLRVTVAKWLTPKGKDLSKEGVHPDIEVERTPDDFTARRDPQLDAAINWMLTGKKPAQAASSAGSSAR